MWAAFMTPIILGCKIFYSCCSSSDGNPQIVLSDKTCIYLETAKQTASGCGARSDPVCHDTAVEHSAPECTGGGIGNQDKCTRRIETKTCPQVQNFAAETMSNEVLNNSVAILAGSSMKVEEVVRDVNIALFLIVLLLLKLTGPRRIMKVISWIHLRGRISTKAQPKLAAKQANVVVTVNCALKPVVVVRGSKKSARDGMQMLVHVTTAPEQGHITTRYLVDCHNGQPSERILSAMLAAHLLMSKRKGAGGGGGGRRRSYAYTGRA